MNNSDSCNTITAQQLIDSIQAEELANIIYKYGNERQSRRIAKAIKIEKK